MGEGSGLHTDRPVHSKNGKEWGESKGLDEKEKELDENAHLLQTQKQYALKRRQFNARKDKEEQDRIPELGQRLTRCKGTVYFFICFF